MAKIDFERAALLMGIARMQPDFPQQQRLVGAAIEELNYMEAELKAEAEKEAKSNRPKARPATDNMEMVQNSDIKQGSDPKLTNRPTLGEGSLQKRSV